MLRCYLFQVGLLTKLYEKCGGDIIVDGKGIEEYDRKTIRKVKAPHLLNLYIHIAEYWSGFTGTLSVQRHYPR